MQQRRGCVSPQFTVQVVKTLPEWEMKTRVHNWFNSLKAVLSYSELSWRWNELARGMGTSLFLFLFCSFYLKQWNFARNCFISYRLSFAKFFQITLEQFLLNHKVVSSTPLVTSNEVIFPFTIVLRLKKRRRKTNRLALIRQIFIYDFNLMSISRWNFCLTLQEGVRAAALLTCVKHMHKVL